MHRVQASWTRSSVIVVVLAMVGAFRAAAEPGPSPPPVPMPPVVGLADIERLDPLRLELLFRNGSAAEIPLGRARGLAKFVDSHSARHDRIANRLWRGKNFVRESGRVVVSNDVAVEVEIRALATLGKLSDVRSTLRSQMLDEGQSVVLDYSKFRPQLFSSTVDEMRLVNARHRLWLGRATLHGKFLCWFALAFEEEP